MSVKESKSPPEESAACERCGDLEAAEIAGRTLCKDCIALAGCGCAGPVADGAP